MNLVVQMDAKYWASWMTIVEEVFERARAILLAQKESIVRIYRTFSGVQALDRVMPIGVGGIYEEVLHMLETTVDYWTCIELAQALEQTMRNDLWSTADRIAETASRITNKPEELVCALKQYEVNKSALEAGSEISDSTISTFRPGTSNFSKAG